ncbi:MAG: sigma 54-interacting transcriptional regulator [Myxococcales bacterium]|nr:sigma 54-interacting transcriptional regulator [Myxococcales bacterium]
MPQLQFEEQGRVLFVHVLRQGRTVIGRSDRCDLALPSERVSRVHCVVEGARDGWRVLDRSRHGTVVNGVTIQEHTLRDGDELRLGLYTLRFRTQADAQLARPTATMPVMAAEHEELVEGTEDGVAVSGVQLRFDRGPLQGRTDKLARLRTTVGGTGADLELDGQLPREALHIRVVRGRPMVEPGQAPTFLGGVRVRQLTPALFGEAVRVGEHGFVIEPSPDQDQRELDALGDMVATSGTMRRLFGALRRMAGHDSPVLLVGESGTGKELAARALHSSSPSHEGPFVALNCAAIAETLFESELFGHEKGAFTGATARTDGAFHHADGGTLFLDEVGEMRLELQAKLLRTLESGEVRRVGSHQPTFPDVRVVAATNRNLPDMVRQGTFREDLYWRLAVLTVRLPPLRERPEDVPVIAQVLLQRHHPGATLSDEALGALATYDWPGNVRELRNVLTRAVVLGGHQIGASDLSFNPWSFDDEPKETGALRNVQGPERRLVKDALERADGNRAKAARILGIPRSTLLYRLERYGLNPSKG